MVIQLVIEIMFALLVTETSLGEAASLAKEGCQDRCGGVIIPYPFGIGQTCSGHESYIITCNSSFTPPRPFLTSINLEVLEIPLDGSTIRVNNPVITSNCSNRDDGLYVNLTNSPFSFSNTYNLFTAIGCNTLAVIKRKGTVVGGCMSVCHDILEGIFIEMFRTCFGIMCCQTRIPPALKYVNPYLRSIDSSSSQEGCKYAFIVDQDWFSSLTNIHDIQKMQHVPAVLDWRTTGGCKTFGDYNNRTNSSVSLCSSHALCLDGILCTCLRNYEGNPYLPDGCQAIDKGSNRTWFVFVIGPGAGLLLLLVPFARKVMKGKKKNMLKEKFFKRNGGILLKQQLTSGKCDVEKIKLFTAKELEKATDHYNENLILGQGGQGTVYKGMLIDGRLVAIKKSKIEDEGKLEHFINEVVILSQVNHRNVVKLYGCCLEMEVPLLVYEFIPNGTLYQYIHEQNEEFPLTWEIRLQIAREIAAAVSYLHAAASIPIYHRDIKSTNILLDDKYRAKVADFGNSRSVAIDQTHLTTQVQGTFGYLDPEYFRSGQFTEKSDVYSFGVVLAELLTGQKPITSTESDEVVSLGTHFIMQMKEDHLFDILDTRVWNEGAKEEIMKLANLAERCLDVNGSKRPTMKEVAMELEVIRIL